MATQLQIVNGPNVWDLMLALFNKERKSFTTSGGELLFDVDGLRRPSASTDHYWHLSGRGRIKTDSSRSVLYYVGAYSDKFRNGTLWVSGSEDMQLLFELHDRQIASQLLSRASMRARLTSHEHWFNREKAEQFGIGYARQLARPNPEQWAKKFATQLIDVLCSHYRYAERTLGRSVFETRFESSGFEVELRSLVRYLEETGRQFIYGFGGLSEKFVRDWLDELDRSDPSLQ